jgi:hypothetical protein
MFRSLLYGHPQGLSFVLGAFTIFPLLASSFAFSVCGRMPSMCMCVRFTCLWVVWSCFARLDNPESHPEFVESRSTFGQKFLKHT